MTAERLLAHYERMAEAPDAIERMRRFILDLAVRGKLVPQDPTEEPAARLLERVSMERQRLFGKRRKDTAGTSGRKAPSAPEFKDRIGWEIASIEEVVLELQTGPFGSALHKSDYQANGTPVVNPASIQGGRIVPIGSMAVGPEALERLSGFRLRAGDIVMARRGEMGRCALITDDAAGWLCGTGSVVLRMPRAVYGRYFALLLGSPYVKRHLEGSAVGTTMLNLNQRILLSLVVGVPPLLEQRRIVDKVAELMALCDRLETTRAEREAARDRLTVSGLARLNAPDPETFREDAAFVLNALPTLTARKDQIAQIRETILNLAVRGKLVGQDPAEEPAAVSAARVKLAKPPRYDKRSPEVISGFCGLSINHPGSELPQGWIWVPLVDIARLESGHTPSRNRADWWGGDVPWIGLVDARLHNDGVISETLQTTNDDGLANSAARLLPAGTVCFSRTASVGYVVIMGRPMATSQDFVNWVPTEAISSTWLQLVLMAERPALHRFSKGAVHQTIYYPAWLSMHIALPPVAEQHRIVARTRELLSLCNRLEASLIQADDSRARLLEALIGEALGEKNIGDAGSSRSERSASEPTHLTNARQREA